MNAVTSQLASLFSARHDEPAHSEPVFDGGIVLVAFALMAIGLIIVCSASMPIADRLHDNPFYFAIRHGIYLIGAVIAAMVVVQLPMQFWRVANPYMLLLAIGLLVAVLLIGRNVNGSTRWLALGPITIQAAEPAKLFFFCYLAGYLVRRYDEVTENLKGFIKPLVVFFILALLLLAQPDLGTVVVMLATTIGLLFLAGARLWQFFALMFVGILAVVALIVFEEYRLRRVTSFLDPWADPFGSGYQLTQSLMAYGRGNWFGQGLGNSLQKLEFLPEAHTDFVMAILAEELGFVGVMMVLLLMLWLVLRALQIGNRALANDRPFDGFMAYSIGIWFSFQTAVNIGASAGILPTKGLTLPLVSYGGSSLIVMAVAVSLLLRIDFELRVAGVQALTKGAKADAKREAKRNKKREAKAKVKQAMQSAEDQAEEASFVDDEETRHD
ncbi:cell division protein FtsW [Marisediminitalea aggregata]|jgi:cell division protein FtsW|uniref:Probable peptidoglycan glycosyltransferase FtsW n=1 Tax=Marisediminitalea aggregata TaxID=634436 RepID=A0A1M5LKV2_9ALTE|nr:cell division protein FtsW [Marisediminitalea aggregata]MAP19633.1 cell division protein FtsW [Alteromonadaceae bacterium]MCP4234365.1 cell division protein FtsW [Aestuariibacter sp.]MEC7469863.1 cell division protein FtsW [Pseudomonadota bacterium]HBY41414.1 cell division protein FtsW [Alteromonas sp.]MCP4525856.1 cell division protein FtsW [Aestuariibacter sp.]|tara:strand:- start:26924 stop:28246 length:1323 start_codon:yes stop_codon:yes gene_type:complete